MGIRLSERGKTFGNRAETFTLYLAVRKFFFFFFFFDEEEDEDYILSCGGRYRPCILLLDDKQYQSG